MLNILYLVKKHEFLTKLCRVRFQSFEKIKKYCNVHYSGIGWSDYNNNITVQQNIDNMKNNFDIIFVYKPLEMKKFNEVKIPTATVYNEMYDINWTLKEINKSGCNFIVCHHLNDCQKYLKMNIPNVKFVYIGHCAQKDIFKNYNSNKKYDIMIGGCVASVYPLRVRLYKILLRLQKKYKIYIHRHPGYNLKDAHTNKYQIEFAKKISQSKIFLSCSSVYKYRLGKYVEVPACGTVLAADIPLDNADNYDYLIKLNLKMSDNEIIKKIEEYLKNNNKLEEKKQKGLEFSKKYTQEKYAERLFNEIKLFLNVND